MQLKNHVIGLKNLMPKSDEYPVLLRETQSLLVEEQTNLIPAYMDGMHVSFLEAKVIAKERECDDVMTKIEKVKARNEIDDFRGDIENIVYGMKRNGSSGYPDLIAMTDDLNSPDPAISNPDFTPFSFEIKPKNFDLGLTGRLLKDDKGQLYSETLVINLDIYDAYNFALKIYPQRIVARTFDGKYKVIHEKDREVCETEKLDFKREEKTYVFDEERKKECNGKTEVLQTDGLKVIYSDFYEKIKKYDQGPILFGHKFNDIFEFLSFSTLTDNHIIWKICKSELGDPNRPLIDAGPYYGEYKGKPRHENTNRLHLMPYRAHLWFDGVMIAFDNPRGIQALMSLGDVVRDIWINPDFLESKSINGWDIVHDKSRGITPENPVRVLYNEGDYQRYPVLKQ